MCAGNAAWRCERSDLMPGAQCVCKRERGNVGVGVYVGVSVGVGVYVGVRVCEMSKDWRRIHL